MIQKIHSPSFKFISNGRGQRFALFAPTNTAFSTVESQGTLQNGVYKIDLETNVIRYRDNDNEYTFPSKVPSSSGDSLTQEHSIQDTANVNSHPKVGEIVKTLLSSHNDTIPNILSPQLFIIQEDGSGVRLWRDIELLGFFRSVAKKIENGGDVRVCEEAVKSSNESGEEEDGAVIAVWVIERLGVSEVAYRKVKYLFYCVRD
ncbi:hypothetical protein BKA69DRAFT_364107 [Paraphysoderma sedebokerense]|nr:hypothetical protein BKA69DRAFT_364107 [Paraphysoderma sedebokerense]